MTNQITNGQDLSQQHTVIERWNTVNNQLDEYNSKLGLNLHKSDAINAILNLTEDQLRLLSAEDCGIKSYQLLQYSLFLQKETNRHAAKVKWSKHNLDYITAKSGQGYGDKYTKYEERQGLLIADNSYAKALNDLLREATITLESLSFLSRKIESMATVLSEIQKTKRGTYEKSRNS